MGRSINNCLTPIGATDTIIFPAANKRVALILSNDSILAVGYSIAFGEEAIQDRGIVMSPNTSTLILTKDLIGDRITGPIHAIGHGGGVNPVPICEVVET